ncbi:MAG: hypothetical protein JWQ27_2343 [Ferruginibacter sp.]|nr:hypothetical protein [Ferruginibacter sp.]
MKALLKYTVYILSLWGCTDHKIFTHDSNSTDSLHLIQPVAIDEPSDTQTSPFKRISAFPEIVDTPGFIVELQKNCHLEMEATSPKVNQSISAYSKIQLFGSNKEYIFLEYDYKDGSMASYPWKYQFVFTQEGKLIKILGALSFEFIEIFPEQNPFLMIVNSTGKGNGGHEIYRISSDSLENIFDGFSDYFPRTYDAHEDNNINRPYGLQLKIYDANKDGLNDIVFSGKIIHNKLSNSIDDKKNNVIIRVDYIFLYDKPTGHFMEKEDYSKKFLYLD